MVETKQTGTPAQSELEAIPDAPRLIDAGRQAQLDEARDEGAGQTSVPVEKITTANDE